MILHVSKNSFSSEVEHISFPAEAAKIRSAMIALEEFGGWAPAHSIQGEGPAQCLTGYISRDDLYSGDGVQKLNQLAGLVDTMDLASQKVFAGALRAESVNDLDDVLRIASSLGQYEFIEGVTTDRELGRWLVEHDPVWADFPTEIRPYLNHAEIGAIYSANNCGAYTSEGYVRRRMAAQTHRTAKRPTFALTLASPAGSVRLDLPFSNEGLEQAKEALQLDSLDSAVIKDVEIDYPWAHLLPMGSVTFEDIATLGECVWGMTKEDRETYGAVLEAVGPRDFHSAVLLAEDIDDYELVTGNEREYAITALRYAGAGDEILEMLDGFTDFDALGRSEMERDGVQETSFGCVRCLSEPWPWPKPEVGQTMC